MDLDWSNGQFTWRYRNMLTLERTFAIHSHHLIPYASAEIYYESQYAKVSTTELYAGALFPMGKHFELQILTTSTKTIPARIPMSSDMAWA